jgi:hypothetical protein
MLAGHKNQLIIVAKMEPGGIADQAVRNGHYVILPVGNDVTATSAEIELTRIKRTGFEKGLEEMGFNSEEAVRYTRDSGQSLSVLRRLLKFEKNSQPDWAKNGHHSDLLPALMAGMWDEQKEEDKAIISLLAGEPYEKYIVRLSRWKNEKDPPVFQVRTIWRVTSAFDSWSVLALFVTKANLTILDSVPGGAGDQPGTGTRTRQKISCITIWQSTQILLRTERRTLPVFNFNCYFW